MRKHKASAKCIKIKGIDKECVIASSDGACIIWDPVEARTRPLNPFCFLFAETHSCKEIIEMILVPNICHYLIKLFNNFCKTSCKNTCFPQGVLFPLHVCQVVTNNCDLHCPTVPPIITERTTAGLQHHKSNETKLSPCSIMFDEVQKCSETINWCALASGCIFLCQGSPNRAAWQW